MAQAAKTLTIDSFALYAADPLKAGKILPDSPQPAQNVNGSPLPFSFSSKVTTAALTLPADPVMLRQQSQQVFLILQYHFGA